MALLVDHKGWGASTLYEKILPTLNGRPLLSNWSKQSLTHASSAGLRADATSHWWAHAHERRMMRARGQLRIASIPHGIAT